MPLSAKDRAAEDTIKAAVHKLFEPAIVDRIAVFPTEEEAGEPALSVTVFLKAGQKRVAGSRLLDTIVAASAALREIEDNRFPYVTFLTTEDDGAEDTRPAA